MQNVTVCCISDLYDNPSAPACDAASSKDD